MAVVRIEAEIPWRIDRADGEHWGGICDPLRLTVESETWAELMEDIALTLDAMGYACKSTQKRTSLYRKTAGT